MFQCLIDDVLHECLGKYVIVYIDNFLIYSDYIQDHIVHERQVLKLLSKHQLHSPATLLATPLQLLINANF